MLEGDMELEDGQNAIDRLDFIELADNRLKHDKAADDVRDAFVTILNHLNGKLGIPPSECCKLLIYNGIVALCSTPEYERSR